MTDSVTRAPAFKRKQMGVRDREQANNFFLYISHICSPIDFFFLYAQNKPSGTKSRCTGHNRGKSRFFTRFFSMVVAYISLTSRGNFSHIWSISLTRHWGLSTLACVLLASGVTTFFLTYFFKNTTALFSFRNMFQTSSGRRAKFIFGFGSTFPTGCKFLGALPKF